MVQTSARRRPVKEPMAVNQWLIPTASTLVVLFCYALIDWSNPEMFVWKRLSVLVYIVSLFVLAHLTPRSFGFINDTRKATIITAVGTAVPLVLGLLFGFAFSHFGVFLAIWALVIAIGTGVVRKAFFTDSSAALMMFGGAVLGSLGIAIVFLVLVSRMV